jgi:transcriptional regulator with XRE-family HTH domain
MTQEQLGKEIGVTAHTIGRWESGKQEPRLTPKQFKKLLEVLEISVDELPDHFGSNVPKEDCTKN